MHSHDGKGRNTYGQLLSEFRDVQLELGIFGGLSRAADREGETNTDHDSDDSTLLNDMAEVSTTPSSSTNTLLIFGHSFCENAPSGGEDELRGDREPRKDRHVRNQQVGRFTVPLPVSPRLTLAEDLSFSRYV